MGAPREVVELAERFDRNVEAYRAGQLNEENTKISYINPLFEALGWDVRNAQGRPGAYQDVVFEDSVKIGGGTKAPDYGFYVGGARRFFLEAKKPSVDLAGDVSPAVQLRRYAWTARHPLSILTDFEEFAVYDCRVEPGKEDKAATARAMYLRYDEYEARWDELYALFGREAVRDGSLEKFAEAERTRRGTETVDRAFLREIEGWRDTLAKNLARRNDLNQRQLNYAVQTTIDRIIFLRMAEDRGIEDYGRLLALVNGNNVYGRMLQMFREADDRYNSGLFHFRNERGRLEEPDDLTPGLRIDDGALTGIIRGLYYPESPYEFSVLPVDVLGQVYEQFLGSVIRLETPEKAVVEQKPEVRKAGGVYYTPTYIVDYIVENTVGKLLEGKRPGPRGGASRLRIADPACGSGSFLIGAYEYLLDWHRDRYVADGPDKHQKRVYEGPGGQWQLTIDEKKRILVNNIHGVDIDPQAVEVTKLSLLLKVLEGETDESITRQLSLFAAERALPDLDANIKCGNSLIGPDFYDEPQMSLLEEEEHYRINVFDWRASFPHVFEGDDSGFDTVIGNPPWGAAVNEIEKPYLRSHYQLNSGKFESYIFFLEQGARLLGSKGILGYIVPSYWISRSQTKRLRDHLFETLSPSVLVVLPESVFEGVKMDSCIIVASAIEQSELQVAEVSKSELSEYATSKRLRFVTRAVESSVWWQYPAFRFNPRIASEDVAILLKFHNNATHLGAILEITQGLTLYRKSTLAEKFGADEAERIVKNRLFHADHKKDDTFKKELLGRDVSRYLVNWNEKSWVSYGPWLAHAVDERFFNRPRLIVQKLRNPTLSQRLVVGYLDDEETYSAGVLLNAIPKEPQYYNLYYLMGLLNSGPINYWYRKSILDVSIRVVDLARVPIPTIDFSDAADVERHDRMVGLVERMLDLHGKLSEARIERERTVLGHRIAATDREIDRLVYELYGLSEEEIKVVEEATKR